MGNFLPATQLWGFESSGIKSDADSYPLYEKMQRFSPDLAVAIAQPAFVAYSRRQVIESPQMLPGCVSLKL